MKKREFRVLDAFVSLCGNVYHCLHQRNSSASSSNSRRTVNYSLFVRGRLQVPNDEFVYHWREVLHGLSIRYSMVGPTDEMYLCDILNRSIRSLGLHLPSLQKLAFVILLFQKHLNLWVTAGILTNFVRNRAIHLIWVKLMAFWTPTFDQFASAHNHGNVVFYNHLPEMVDCVRQRTLATDDLFVPHCWWILSFEWTVGVASVNIISFTIFVFFNSSFQLDSWFSIGKNVNISVTIHVHFALY